MLINELVKELQAIEKKYGNIRVRVWDNYGQMDNIGAIQFYECHPAAYKRDNLTSYYTEPYIILLP